MVYGLRLAPTVVVFWDQRWTATKDPGTFLCQDHSSWRLVWCPRLNWAPRRKKKKGRGDTLGSWENVSSENKELDLFAVFPPLHTVNVDEHSCIIFELLLSWKMRSKSIEDERVSVCVAELRKSFRGELCLFSEIQTVVVLLETAFKSSVLQCLSVILSFFLQLEYFFVFFVDSSVTTQFWKQRSRVQSLDPRIGNVLPTKRCTFFWILKENITFHLFLYPTYPN